MLPLPKLGLAADGVHPNTYYNGSAYRACSLTSVGLQYGFNVRNLLSLRALDRVKAILDGGSAPDTTAKVIAGEGSAAKPFEITSLPFTDSRNTKSFGASNLSVYDGCSATQNESGNEVLYRFVTTGTVKIRAMVIDQTGVDIDLHLLDTTPETDRCIARNDKVITATLDPGTYWFSLDTFVSSGVQQSGEYVFVLLEE
jgi:hypothetical protein